MAGYLLTNLLREAAQRTPR